ncbi:VOC family protein [Paenisporosarcina quisquiliarum]|uniref:VOC family protein n=1 Tax=Paenisporosarcina quisquiliarum TaxID=365346 RepID=UPI003736D729
MSFHQHPSTYPKHVHLIVSDLTKSTAFYENIIGLHILNKTEDKVEFTANRSDVLLIIEQSQENNVHIPGSAGLYHLALLLPSKEELGALFNHIRNTGYPFSGASDHKVSEALYLNDLDGNGIELYYDRSPETWNWQNEQVEMTVDPLDIEGLIASATKAEWSGISSGTVMGHIHLSVSNLEKAEEFYVHALGFDIVSRYGSQATFISSNGYHHHIALNTWGRPKAIERNNHTLGLHEFSLVYPNLETRELVVNRLQDIDAVVTVKNNIVRAIDPSGAKVLLLVE